MAVRNGFPDEVLGNLYPFEDRTVILDDGTSMHYVEAGSAGFRGPQMLLLHGNPTWSFLWRNQIMPWARHARVVAVDHVGFGRSDHPRELGYHTLERHIRNLEEFVRKLGMKRVVPVVQDWGGPIGLGWATRHADMLAGLVVLNTWAFTRREPIHPPMWFRAMYAPLVGEWLFRRRNAFVETLIPKVSVRPVPQDVMAGYRHPFPNPESRAALLAMPRMIPTGPKHPDWATLDAIEGKLGLLDVPAKIVWPDQDVAFGKRFAHAFRAALPRAEAPVFLPDAGHFPQEDAPEALATEVAGFIRGL